VTARRGQCNRPLVRFFNAADRHTSREKKLTDISENNVTASQTAYARCGCRIDAYRKSRYSLAAKLIQNLLGA